ncbi:hypothetical protein PROVRUST_04632 [Providencia rustigianii DSM 4541]|uniref:Uncharacterized protein n=1 Tax=Providencia rustigianii DSM 4541 TaxID=500637 RepID=D1NXK3_9GAMM|nr:hypothetical protein PROVRUST_04632 [Providencia rustigianii DSM 4541]
MGTSNLYFWCKHLKNPKVSFLLFFITVSELQMRFYDRLAPNLF